MTYTAKALKEELRDGQYGPGGYERTYITSDGEVLCHDCVLANLRTILTAMRDPHDHSGWRIIGVDSAEVQEPTTTTMCAQCSRIITEQTEPDVDGGDITTQDYRVFYQYGKRYLSTCEDSWQPKLRAAMERDGYYPSVWFYQRPRKRNPTQRTGGCSSIAEWR